MLQILYITCHNDFGLPNPPQRTQAPSTSAPSMRRQLCTWPPAGATWTACSPCCRLGLSPTSPTRPEKRRSTKVRSCSYRIAELYWHHQGRTAGSLVMRCWKSVMSSCFLLRCGSPLSPMPDLPCHGLLSNPVSIDRNSSCPAGCDGVLRVRDILSGAPSTMSQCLKLRASWPVKDCCAEQ